MSGPRPDRRIPEAIMPRSATAVRVLVSELDEWWESLKPGQRMTVYLAAVADLEPTEPSTEPSPDPQSAQQNTQRNP